MSKNSFLKIGHRFREHKLAQMKGSKLSVLLCLALHMNEYGHAWPSLERMAHLTGYNEKTVRRAISWLKKKRYLTKQENPGVPSNTWLVTVPFVGGHIMEPMGTRVDINAIDAGHLSHAATHGKRSQMSTKVDTEKYIQKEDVVVSHERPKDITLELREYSKEKCKGPNIEAYARGVLRRNPNWKTDKRRVDSDSDEARQRYIGGEYADFWDDAE